MDLIQQTIMVMQQKPQLDEQLDILIVDDLEQNLVLLKSILEPLDARLILAQSGREALEKLAMHDIVLALIDVKMPEMNGFELVKLMQQDTTPELIPVIFITAHTDNISEIENYYVKGVVDFITKPFKHHILLNKVKVFLELHRQKLQIRKQTIEHEALAAELKEINQEINIRLAFEKLLVKISGMAVSAKSLDDFIDTSLSAIGHAISASRTYIIEYSNDTETFSNTHEWCAGRISSETENIRSLPVNKVKWLHDTLINGRVICINNIDDIPEQSTKDVLKAWDICSILAVPLFTGGKYFGYVGFDFCYRKREWQDTDVDLLISISRIFSSVIERSISESEIMKRVETEYALLNASLDSVFLIELDGTLVAHNEIMAHRLNLAADELVGKCVYDLLPLETRRLKKQKVEEVIRTGLPMRFEDCSNGYFFEHSIYPIKSKSGNVYRIAIFGCDITQKKHTETALRESEKMYRTLLSASPQGIVILDMKKMIISISNITVEIFGASSVSDFIGKDFFSIIPNKEIGNIKTILSKTISDGLIQNEEIILEKKNKSPFISEISATLIQEEGGNPKAYMVIIRDISHKKIMEQHFIHSERMVSLGEMASSMAHEINQPLLSIQLGIENLLNKIQQTNTADKDYLKIKSEKIFEDIMRINNIIDHVRAFSRDQKYINDTFNINESIRNAISLIAHQFKHHGIRIIVELDKNMNLINGDTYRLEQVILNMLSNAKDAIKEKGITQKNDFDKHVSIRSYQDDDFVFVEVEDNGIGINLVDVNRIFIPFYTTKEKGKGTGLGLAIAFVIIKEFDGKINVESKPGVGSTFRIELPKYK